MSVRSPLPPQRISWLLLNIKRLRKANVSGLLHAYFCVQSSYHHLSTEHHRRRWLETLEYIYICLINGSRLISVLPVEMFSYDSARCPSTRTYMVLPSNTTIRLGSVGIWLAELGALDLSVTEAKFRKRFSPMESPEAAVAKKVS